MNLAKNFQTDSINLTEVFLPIQITVNLFGTISQNQDSYYLKNEDSRSIITNQNLENLPNKK